MRAAGRASCLSPATWSSAPTPSPSIQARKRIHPSAPPASARVQRVEHEYERMGSVCYLLDAWDVRRGGSKVSLTDATPPPARTSGQTDLRAPVSSRHRRSRTRAARADNIALFGAVSRTPADMLTPIARGAATHETALNTRGRHGRRAGATR
jgi:hypothetical protein